MPVNYLRANFPHCLEHCIELLTLALGLGRPAALTASRYRITLMKRIKDFVDQNLGDPDMNTAMVARGVGMSSRYINDIFNDEETSLMRHIWKRRLENCRRDLLSQTPAGHRISDIAFRWGFNDLSHFSRTFKQSFALSPRDYRRHNAGEAASSGSICTPE
jgi:AraC family transcriptional activator of tynA and feaB